MRVQDKSVQFNFPKVMLISSNPINKIGKTKDFFQYNATDNLRVEIDGKTEIIGGSAKIHRKRDSKLHDNDVSNIKFMDLTFGMPSAFARGKRIRVAQRKVYARKLGYVPREKFDPDIISLKTLFQNTLSETNAQLKGKHFEDLSYELFRACGDVFSSIHQRVRINKEEELDLIVFTKPNYFFRDWGHVIIGECKSGKELIDVNVIHNLAGKIGRKNSTAGVLFSISGITQAAKNEMRNTFRHKKIIILHFDRKDLKQIIEGENFIDLLNKKYEERSMGK